MKWKNLIFLLVLALPVLSSVGCEKKTITEEGLSPQVHHLWLEHPTPWTKEAAQKAADAAFGLLTEYSEDIQLRYYWEDRLLTANPAHLRRILKQNALTYPDNLISQLLYARINPNTDEAIKTVSRLAKKHSKEPFTISTLALFYLISAPPEYDQAEILAKRALILAPNLPQSNHVMAKVLLARQKAAEAEEYARKAYETYPASFEIVATLAACYEAQSKLKESITLLQHYNAGHPNNPALVNALAARYEAMKQYDRMFELLRSRAESVPEDGWAWYDLARTYAHFQNPDSSIAALNHAVDNGFYDYHLLSIELKDEQNPFFLFWRYLKTAQNLQKGLPLREALDNLEPPVDHTIASRISADFSKAQKRMLDAQRSSKEERMTAALVDTLATPAPDFSLVNLEGDTVSLADYKGEAVVLHFHSLNSQQTPYILPRLRGFYITQATPGRDSQLLTINIDGGDVASDLRSSFDGKGVLWPVLLADQSILEEFDVIETPSFIIIDPDGQIRYQIEGYIPFLDETLGWMSKSLLPENK